MGSPKLSVDLKVPYDTSPYWQQLWKSRGDLGAFAEQASPSARVPRGRFYLDGQSRAVSARGGDRRVWMRDSARVGFPPAWLQ